MTAVLPTLAEVREQRVSVNLDRLPSDPDGWCSWEVAEGGWRHTPLCRQGVESGGPKLCEMWAARDARDAAKRRRPSQYELAQIDAYESSHAWPYSGGYDPELDARQGAAWRGMGVEDEFYGRGAL